jgi:hypothetical protein
LKHRRLTVVAAELCQTVVLAGWVVASQAALGPPDMETTGALPVTSPAIDAAVAQAPQATATSAALYRVDMATLAESMKATGEATAPDQQQPLAGAAEIPPAEAQPVQVASLNTPDPVPNEPQQVAGSIEIFDECFAVDVCVDRYLWALYQRTPKQDTIKVSDSRRVKVKRKGKVVTVRRTFTRLVDEDFTWKDPQAADKVNMSMADYVIGGMDRSFKLKLFHVLRAAEQAGLSPGITSAFRDDYRQSIASGLKAASDRSYHGGSFRGGYGHGLAADVVSVKGATRAERWVSTESLWKWLDEHEQQFAIGRPYLDRDPPHLAPIDGKEWADHRPAAKPQDAGADAKKRNSAEDDRAAEKRRKLAKS